MPVTKLVFAFAIGSAPTESGYPFGYQQGLPWGHLKEDLKNFKEITKDSILLMGGQTFRSLPGKLPGRMHTVLSSDGSQIVAKNGERADIVFKGGSLSATIDVLRGTYPDKDISIIGGKRMIEECISSTLVDEIHSTSICIDPSKTLSFDVCLDHGTITSIQEKYSLSGSKMNFVEGNDLVTAFLYQQWNKK
ncbi:dihydrofolate reductase [Pantoea phage Phynn]|nr:dihydrofolate reductase [Pantoea phage Phynn]